MTFELDHLFICTKVGAAKAERLIALGLVEGSSSTHPGQSTANRRFFFRNAMLELLWVHNQEEARSEAIWALPEFPWLNTTHSVVFGAMTTVR
jgi:hypothetical protein